MGLDVPCLTLRPSTERPVTVEAGTNRLVTPAGLTEAVARMPGGDRPVRRPIPPGNGMAGARMAAHAREFLAARMAPARAGA